MKFGITMVVIGVLMLIFQIQQEIVAQYRYEREYGFAWNLADKSSTIQAKADYISQFASLIECNSGDFASHDAMWLKTPDNSLEANVKALKTLDGRLRDVITMDIKSFEYQIAIQQITQQEQGEADEMIGKIKRCWVKHNHLIAWRWMTAVCMLIWLPFICVGIITIGYRN